MNRNIYKNSEKNRRKVAIPLCLKKRSNKIINSQDEDKIWLKAKKLEDTERKDLCVTIRSKKR